MILKVFKGAVSKRVGFGDFFEMVFRSRRSFFDLGGVFMVEVGGLFKIRRSIFSRPFLFQRSKELLSISSTSLFRSSNFYSLSR